eukprot:663527-Amorphochlora_amoeboformis.AAC.2
MERYLRTPRWPFVIYPTQQPRRAGPDPETGGTGQTSVRVEVLLAPSVTSVAFSPSAGDVRETVFQLVAHAT